MNLLDFGAITVHEGDLLASDLGGILFEVAETVDIAKGVLISILPGSALSLRAESVTITTSSALIDPSVCRFPSVEERMLYNRCIGV